MVAEQGLYILLHTFVYSHVSHKQHSTPAPGTNNRQRQDQVEEDKQHESQQHEQEWEQFWTPTRRWYPKRWFYVNSLKSI